MHLSHQQKYREDHSADRIWPVELGYQTNWQTVNIGGKWWGLSAARVYDFATGRFTQRDLAHDSFNNYLYTSENINANVDPTGLAVCCKKADGTHRIDPTSCTGSEHELDMSFCCPKAKPKCCDPVSITFKTTGPPSFPRVLGFPKNIPQPPILGAIIQQGSAWKLYANAATLFYFEAQIVFTSPCGDGCTWGVNRIKHKGTPKENSVDDTPFAINTYCSGNTVYYWDAPGQKTWVSTGAKFSQHYTVWAQGEDSSICPKPVYLISKDYTITTAMDQTASFTSP